MIRVRRVPRAARLVDGLLLPIMFLVGGCKRDSIQETHYWHCQPIDAREIDPSLCVSIAGTDVSPMTTNRVWPLPLFHVPLLGGWRDYVVLRVPPDAVPWHVGWIHRATPPGSRPRAHVQRLPIAGREVRVLAQPKGFVTDFFALGTAGEQLPLTRVGEGRLGDRRYDRVRLF